MTDAIDHSGTIDWSSELERNGRWLRSVLLARSRDPGAIDELFQELSLAVVRHGGSLRDPARMAPWLYQIAVRQALMHRRKLGRRRRLLDSYENRRERTEQVSCEADPLEWLLSDERSCMIRQAIDSLPSKESELLILKYTEDWSYREIARHLGISESAVEARLHRARRKLRAELTRRQVVEVTS